ncbi:MAG: universal stress protein [Oleiphilus sp.]|nr:MAG: universal stress protein [Oleiphilus sp.]
MSEYSRILVALECSHNAEQVLEKTRNLLQRYPEAEYSLVHVVLDVVIADWAGLPGQVPPAIDQQELAQAGAEYLKPLIEKSGLDPNLLTVCFGTPAQSVLDSAEEFGADLIVAGSHSRKGLEILLGSTAHKILNLAKCDVLLIRTPRS